MPRWLRLAALGYLLTQAVGIAWWWLWLWRSAEGRAQFAPSGSEHALMAFVPGDLLVLTGVASVAVVGILRGARWTGAVLWLHAGAGVYAGCWAVALWQLETARGAGALLMLPVVVGSLGTALWWSWSAPRRCGRAEQHP